MTHNLISGNHRHGVHLSGTRATGNILLNNTIGLDLTGQTALGNRGSGVVIDGAPDNHVGSAAGLGNVISGNHQSGILIQGENGPHNIIAGNFIGTNKSGTAAIGNGWDGVALVGTHSTTIGGDRENAANLISGNGQAGVSIDGGYFNFVQGNRIGTDKSGTRSLPNLYGIEIEGSPDNRIGSTSSEFYLGNVISGNEMDGIHIQGHQAERNIIDGNQIGTDKDGVAAIPNGGDGVQIYQAPNNEVGVASEVKPSNVISGNTGYGVHVVGTYGTDIRNNYIGIGKTEVSLPNVLGGVFLERTHENVVGGRRQDGAGNTISGNAAGPGVRIADSRLDELYGNCIGTDSAGAEPRPNLYGVVLERSRNITIGRPDNPGSQCYLRQHRRWDSHRHQPEQRHPRKRDRAGFRAYDGPPQRRQRRAVARCVEQRHRCRCRSANLVRQLHLGESRQRRFRPGLGRLSSTPYAATSLGPMAKGCWRLATVCSGSIWSTRPRT